MISIAIMGHGVVGSGVSEIITTHKNKLFASIGEEIYIKYILDLRDFPDSPLAGRFTKNFDDIINDVDVRIVVEAMGGLNPAYDFVKRLLLSGKSVVTSNKELVAAKGAELIAIAKDNNANLLFEASVGGGIPIIRPINQCLVANDVSKIAGILNGTTNYILTKMIYEGMEFSEALKLAQQLGYAEKDPTADIEGYDACRKICILASLTYGRHIYPEQVYTEGITGVTLEDVEYACAWGGVIKLIGEVRCVENGKKDIFVAPMFIPNSSQLANIDDVFNGIMVRGDCTGDVVFYGKGAGMLPTASAVVADIVDCCRHLKTRKYIFWTDSQRDETIDAGESVNAMFVRVKTADVCKALADAEGLFGNVRQIVKTNQPDDELAFVTEPISFDRFKELIADLENKGVQIVSKFRIGDL